LGAPDACLLATLPDLVRIAIWSFTFARSLRTTRTAPNQVRRARGMTGC
jgi:hypothetical protein